MSLTEKQVKLNDTTVTIELTLLSVIQGVALYFLVDNARISLLSLNYEYWVYIAIAFLFLFTFWSQALVHVLSFISWPLEFIHNFLYFLVILAEVLMFQTMTSPLAWFATNSLFFVVAGILYYLDIRLLASKKENFDNSEERKRFYKTIFRHQNFSLAFFIPVGFFFSTISYFLIYTYPDIFIAQHWHLLLAGIQALVGIASLSYFVSTFKKHLMMIENI